MASLLLSTVNPDGGAGGVSQRSRRTGLSGAPKTGDTTTSNVLHDHLRHEEDRAELLQLIRRQAERIEKLKLDAAVQLEHRSTLRRLELEGIKESTAREIAALTPQLELVRAQWSQAREASSGYEVQWGSMRSQLQQLKGRVEALQDACDTVTTQNESTRHHVKEMREQLHRLNRDKANLRQKVKGVLEALVTDDEVLKTRLHEEELYRNQMVQAHHAMRAEYSEAQQDVEQEFAPLRDDVRLLNTYLEEMQQRTKSLEKFCIDLEMKLFQVERKWVEDVHSVFGSLERANQRVQIRSLVLSALEQQLVRARSDPNVKPRSSNGSTDTLWLSNSLAVWESVIKKEINQQKQKLQMREDGAQLLAKTSQVTQRTKQDLDLLKSKVEGEDYERRLLLHEISAIHFLLQEKKINEEQMIHFVQEVCTQLDENLPAVLQYIRKEGFDDYVSSTDEDEDEVQGFAALQEERSDDVLAVMSSLDLDPDDPQYHERLRQMTHRPPGPLLEFAQRKAAFLKEVAEGGGRGLVAGRLPSKSSSSGKPLLETLDRAVMSVQRRLGDEVVAFVRNRQQQIQQGLLDPRNERLNADPKYVEHARLFHHRVDAFVQHQKEVPARAGGRDSATSPQPLGASGAGAPSGRISHKIIIEGARVPTEVVRGNPMTTTTFYTTKAVRGVHALVYVRSTMMPQLRHIFLSRDLSRIIARRVDSRAMIDLDAAAYDDATTTIRVADVHDIVLGHKTDVFREVRLASKHVIREESAFSILSVVGTTLDVECDSLDDRNYWASCFAWIVNESRPGGVLHILQRSGKISVVDSLNHTAEGVEIADRQNLHIRISS